MYHTATKDIESHYFAKLGYGNQPKNGVKYVFLKKNEQK